MVKTLFAVLALITLIGCSASLGTSEFKILNTLNDPTPKSAEKK